MKVSAINTTNFKSITEVKRAEAEDFPNQPIIHHEHKKINPVSVTGWTGVAAMCTAVVSGMMHKPVLHKISAFIGVGAIAGHIGLVSASHHFMKSQFDKKA
jgi:hypothetical protein